MNYTDLDLVILKTLISEKKYALEFAAECEAKLFGSDVWIFANGVINYLKIYKELPTLRVLTEKTNNSKQIEYITALWNKLESINYDYKEYKHDLEKLKKRYAEKQILQAKDVLNKVEEDKIDLQKSVQDLQKTVQNIKSIEQNKAYDKKTLKEAIHHFTEEYKAKQKNPNLDRGISTGMSFLDYATDGGVRSSELFIICGESGGGKSLYLNNIGINIWRQDNTIDQESDFKKGYNVLYFSLEMPFNDCFNRVLANLANVPSKNIKNAKLTKEESLKVSKALKFIKNYPHEFEIVDVPRGATISSIENIYKEAKSRYNPDIVIIDYLGIMEADREDLDKEDWLKLEKISEKVHEFARVNTVGVITAMQLNRSKAKEVEEKIGLHRLARSNGVARNANVVIQIESRPQEQSYPDSYYWIIKNRNGMQGKGKMLKSYSCAKLIDCPIELDAENNIKDIDDISDEVEFIDFESTEQNSEE